MLLKRAPEQLQWRNNDDFASKAFDRHLCDGCGIRRVMHGCRALYSTARTVQEGKAVVVTPSSAESLYLVSGALFMIVLLFH